MAAPSFEARSSLTPGMRIAICAALIAVSALLVFEEAHLHWSGAHVIGEVTELQVVHEARGRHSQTRTWMRFRAPSGAMTECCLGDVHARVGQMLPLRFLPPASCGVAGDLRGVVMWSAFALIGAAGIAWTLSRRAPKGA